MSAEKWDESDADLAALVGRPRKKVSIKQIAPQLIAIAGITFALGYYVPMHRAHGTLTDQHATEQERVRHLSQSLEQAQSELRQTTEQRQVLSARVEAADEERKRKADRLTSLQEQLSSSLAKPVKAGAIQVSAGDQSVTVSIDAKQIFVAGKLDVDPKGKDLLCDVARGAGSNTLEIRAAAGEKELAPAPLRRTLSGPWSLGAAKAAAVVDALASGCRVPASRIVSAGAVAPSKDRSAAIDIVVRPAE